MRIAILYNGHSKNKTDRTELIDQLRSKGHEVFVGGIYTGSLNPYYDGKKVSYIPICASRDNTNPFVELKSLFSVMKQIKKHSIDAAIVYGVKNHAAMAIGSKLGGAQKIVCIVNGSGNLFRIAGIKGKLLRFISFPMLKLAYNLSSYICFQNPDDKELFINKHIIKKEEKMFLTGGSGVNLDLFPDQPLVTDNKFLFLARITPSKGIKEYIEAAAIVKQKYPNAMFDIVGPLDSTIEESSEYMFQNACNADIVRYHGVTDDVAGWMGKCRIFVYPSYYPEGVPRCAIQAIASGRPIITCNTPGCKETVVDGCNGLLVPPKNSAALAEKMIWMIEHKMETTNMGKESRKYALKKFNVYEINELIINRVEGN